MTYRREIDGLRAIAVCAVVLYHAGVGGAGYLGVDVFFVISGYLITSLLVREREMTGRIDLGAFYARRMRRILPAATALVIGVLALSWLFLPAPALVATAQSAESAAVFGANVYFQETTGGYFDTASDQLPLLHLWSLAVEEQFYLVWPALLIAAWAWRTPAMSAVAAISLVMWLSLDAQAAFYQTPARCWELAAGGLVATRPPAAAARWVVPAALLGVLLALAVPLGTMPAAGNVLVVACTATLLWAIRWGATNALLASRPLVGVGLVSYSVYLWHWPLLAIYRATSANDTLPGRLALCALSVLLAIASYRYIETPFRNGRIASRPTLALGFASLVLTGLGAFVLGTQARPVPADLVAMDKPPTYLRCHYGPMDTQFPRRGCTSIPGRPARVALWGDSLALAWQPLAIEIGARQNMSATAYSRDACWPAVGFLAGQSTPQRRCRDWNARVVAALSSADTVLIAGRWQREMATERSGDFADAMGRTLRALADVRRVIVIGPSPELPGSVPDCMRSGSWSRCHLARLDFDRSSAPARSMLRALVSRHANAEYVEVADWLCQRDCEGRRDGIPLYWDDFHPTTTAAKAFAKDWQMRPALPAAADRGSREPRKQPAR